MPIPCNSLGAAFSWAAFEPGDESVDAFFSLSTARSVEEALPLLRRIQAIPLNMVVADRENIAWQVTGRYPLRKNGRGLMPSPGWTGEYDWIGYLDPGELPCALNPAEGFIGTANNRTVPSDYPHVLSSSWYWPSRAERIVEMIAASDEHTLESSMDMQLDVRSTFAPEVRGLLLEGPLSSDIPARSTPGRTRAVRPAHERRLRCLSTATESWRAIRGVRSSPGP